LSQTPELDTELKKELIAPFFMNLRLHFRVSQYFWGKISHFINFEKLAHGN